MTLVNGKFGFLIVLTYMSVRHLVRYIYWKKNGEDRMFLVNITKYIKRNQLMRNGESYNLQGWLIIIKQCHNFIWRVYISVQTYQTETDGWKVTSAKRVIKFGQWSVWQGCKY